MGRTLVFRLGVWLVGRHNWTGCLLAHTHTHKRTQFAGCAGWMNGHLHPYQSLCCSVNWPVCGQLARVAASCERGCSQGFGRILWGDEVTGRHTQRPEEERPGVAAQQPLRLSHQPGGRHSFVGISIHLWYLYRNTWATSSPFAQTDLWQLT